MKTLLALGTLLPLVVVFAGLNMNTVTLPESELQNVKAVAGQSHLPATVTPVLERACRDCHSNQTVWPWYSRVPPMSLLVKHDVDEGRAKFNFSNWASGSATPTPNQVQEICDAASDGSMPPKSYRIMHFEARLNTQDVDTLCGWADNARSANASLPAER
jgi:hypothetical protein